MTNLLMNRKIVNEGWSDDIDEISLDGEDLDE